MKRRNAALLAVALLCCLLLALSVVEGVAQGTLVLSTAEGPSIGWWVMGGGGGPMSSTNYAVNGTIGQTPIGPAESTNHDLGVGYWYGAVIQIGPVEFKMYLPLVLRNF